MRILLAIDGSKSSQAAAHALATQFRIAGAEVLVLHVVEPLVYSVPPQMAPGYAPEMASRIKERLQQARESASATADSLRAAGFKVESRVAEDEIRTAILDIADEWRADLIVLGAHGEKSLRRDLLGSVTEFVARHARCSVLIVREAPDR